MSALAALFCGLVFGFGLVISGMAQPAKVLNFLDLFGPLGSESVPCSHRRAHCQPEPTSIRLCWSDPACSASAGA
jgi:Family of unknown function (DUF6691)